MHHALTPTDPRYWAAAERLGSSGDAGAAVSGLEGLRSAFVDMVTVMQQVQEQDGNKGAGMQADACQTCACGG